MQRRLYSYRGFTIQVVYKSGRIAQIRVLDRRPAGLPGLPQNLRVDISDFTPFERAVMGKLMEVPPGRVVTYGMLASAAGYPGAARAVGRVMAKNPYAVVVPCHRVVRSDLHPGSYAYGTGVKRRLLLAEGVRFNGDRISRKHIHRFKV
ncbi:methylated-DNA--[protein]-cysteine S-methyltransferase [Candidatus Pyrohabitans sp.]